MYVIVTCILDKPVNNSGLFSGDVNDNQVSFAMERVAAVCSIRPIKRISKHRQVAAINFTQVGES